MLDITSFLNSKEDHEFLFFWKHINNSADITKACLSQWYPSSFFDGAQFYNCAEQYMMAQKARLMRDTETEKQIMNQTDPKTIKALGKKVAPFDKELWDTNKVNIVVKGNMLKFSQNPLLGQFLLSTGDKVLVEASPYDEIWGIALDENDPRALRPSQWKGRNLLGFALMEVRERLKKEKEKEQNGLGCGVTPENITSLKKNEVFVFGSNIGGYHGGGAAAYALKHFGAIWGVGVGMQGQSYAIPTVQGSMKKVRPYVDQFIDFAAHHPHLHFLVTKIGCGKAGFKIEDIAPLFARASGMSNVSLPQEFIDVLSPKPPKITKEDKNLALMWTINLGSSSKAFYGLDPMPSKEKTATKDSLKMELLPMPEEHSTVLLNHTISTSDMDIILKGHIPDTMEDHWFMYCDDNTIRYYRSWTGVCVYIAHYVIDADKTLITRLKINRDKNQYKETDDQKDKLIFLYLLTAEYGGDASKIWNQIFHD